jgi:hypothetical protein
MVDGSPNADIAYLLRVAEAADALLAELDGEGGIADFLPEDAFDALRATLLASEKPTP